MNDKKICFIICSNSPLFLEECKLYLSLLEVPEGIETELLVAEEASSMAAGYNEAMRESNAKYKVYLHQDVFIVNRYFIGDILDIFQKDDAIGMIGMAGVLQMPADGVMWHGKRCGNVYGSDLPDSGCTPGRYRYSLERDGYREAEAADGLLLATNRDIAWREDLFTGWDFYDAAQCFEYRRQGYRVVVPNQTAPWCVHNDGILNAEHYEEGRQVFLREYGGRKR